MLFKMKLTRTIVTRSGNTQLVIDGSVSNFAGSQAILDRLKIRCWQLASSV